MRTRTSGASEAGFTLIELLAVLAILALAAAAFSYRSQAGFGAAKFRALMIGTAAALRETRASAISAAGERVFVIDTKTGKLGTIDVPEDVEFDADVAKSETTAQGAGIRFFKDGSSSGGTVRLSWNNRRYAIDVNWLTGNVAIKGL